MGTGRLQKKGEKRGMNEEKRIATGVDALAMTETKRTPELIGAEIRMYVDAGRRVTLLCGIEIGRRLKEAKELLAHGEWLPWLEKETDFSDRTAQRYMRVFEEYGAAQLGLFGPETNATTLSDLPISKALLLLSVPESDREDFAAQVDAEHLSTRELEQAIRERDEALKRAQEELQQADEGHALAMADLQEKLEEAREEAGKGKKALELLGNAESEKRNLEQQLNKARDAIRELESRPVDVAVERDEEAIQEAARLAKAKAEAEAAEQLAALQKKLETAEKKAEKAEKAAEKAKAEAERSGEADKTALAQAAREAEKARQEAEELRKQLKLADPAAAEFKAYFDQMQKLWGSLTGIIRRADPELSGKLKQAARALLDRFGADIAEGGGENVPV
jgi:DNA repair exonuclease SbcCD ATPase subunit